jgi:type IV secretory pathway TraG/TraD family ATPase VirD4
MLLALDEVTQICPVPLPLWMADSAGKGILIVAVCHGLAQLEARWDSAGARAIWDTAGIKVILGGVTDPDTLDRLSRLCGEIRLRTHSRTHDQYRGRGHTVSYEPVPVLPPDLLRTLPEWRALIVRGNLSPVIVRLRMAWKRRDYRHARQHNRAPHRPLPAAVEPPEEPAPVIGYGLILPPPQNGSPWHSQPGLQPVGADDELASQRDTRRPEAAPPWALPPGAHPPVPAPPGGGRRPPRPRRPWDPPADLGGQK